MPRITHDGGYTTQTTIVNETVYDMWKRSSDKAVVYTVLSGDELIEHTNEYMSIKTKFMFLLSVKKNDVSRDYEWRAIWM